MQARYLKRAELGAAQALKDVRALDAEDLWRAVGYYALVQGVEKDVLRQVTLRERAPRARSQLLEARR